MSGRLVIVGLGPGDAALCTPQVSAALAEATDLIGYGPYLQRVEGAENAIRHASDNREELDRARHALSLASEGRRVAVVSSGDAGVFAMASAIFEAIEHGDPAWKQLDVAVLPGISAMLAVAARLGAPLGHDFCVISLSDNLKPWPLVLRRLQAAATAGLSMALYNPVSAARPWQLGEAFAALRDLVPSTVPVVFATAVSRPDERIVLTDLARATPAQADMRTLILVGTETTRIIERGDGRAPWLYAPRGAPRGTTVA